MRSPSENLTTQHVRKARLGDVASLDWLIHRFTPLMIAQARYRLGEGGACEPEDLVAEVWMVALPRLAELKERDGRITPVLVRFLGTTLRQRHAKLADRHRRREVVDFADEGVTLDGGLGSSIDRAIRRESKGIVLNAIEDLDPMDRAAIVLRAIEEVPNAEAAEMLGLEPNTLAVRYRRALERLREALPESVFAEL